MADTLRSNGVAALTEAVPLTTTAGGEGPGGPWQPVTEKASASANGSKHNALLPHALNTMGGRTALKAVARDATLARPGQRPIAASERPPPSPKDVARIRRTQWPDRSSPSRDRRALSPNPTIWEIRH